MRPWQGFGSGGGARLPKLHRRQGERPSSHPGDPRCSAIGSRAARLRAYLELGRLSNLPTVWTNVLAGASLATAELGLPVVALAGAFSLLYTGGMALNDAFDRRHDACDRPTRPIPSGRIGAQAAFLLGAGLLVLGLAVVGTTALAVHGPRGGTGPAVAAGLVLIGLIVLYDWAHKANPYAPLVMGLCRGMIYPTVALALTPALPAIILLGSFALTMYVGVITHLGRQPPYARHMPVAIAGISLLDAILLASVGASAAALVAVLGGGLALSLQRAVSGT